MRRLIRHLLLGIVATAVTVGVVAPVLPAGATTCQTHCLRVSRIQTYTYLYGIPLQANVWLVNEDGGAVRGAVVQGQWTQPDSSTVTRYARIGVRGRAEFPLYTTQTGTFTFTVLGATIPGTDYVFDPEGSSVVTVTVTR
ncbi:MAG: hypothetical protein R2731_13440 [Nocardioides sp.]